MQGHTKTRHTEEARFTGKPSAIARLRQLASELGAQEVNDNIPALEVFPELATNRPGVVRTVFPSPPAVAAWRFLVLEQDLNYLFFSVTPGNISDSRQ